MRFFGYRFVGEVAAEHVKAAEACLLDLEPLMAAAPMKLISQELLILGAKTVSRRESDLDGELRAMAYAEELSRYPDDVVVWACREWVRLGEQGKWWPSWAELRALCERRVERRRALADCCRDLAQRWVSGQVADVGEGGRL